MIGGPSRVCIIPRSLDYLIYGLNSKQSYRLIIDKYADTYSNLMPTQTDVYFLICFWGLLTSISA